MKLSNAVKAKFQRKLTQVNPIFGEMWKRGGFVFSDEYDTAALEIHEGKFRISFNLRYWKRLGNDNRLFIICHEYWHVVLGHWLNPIGNVDSEWMNIAQDIQVNEILCKTWFKRDKIKNWKDQAWIDTVFKDKAHLVEKDQDAEYYYKLLIQCLTPEV